MPEGCGREMAGKRDITQRAFTLIELLVVIAIIAILAAIIFPVFAQVKISGYRASDISNMNQIRTAMLLYKTDQGGAPPALLGYISPYEYAQGVTIVPADRYFGPLYPKRVNSISILKPALVRVENSLLVPAAWPQADSRAVGTAPIVDTNGDGQVTGADDTGGTRQAFSSTYGTTNTLNYYTTGPLRAQAIGSTTNSATNEAGRFYAVSGYDVGLVRTPGGDVYELRYTPFWTGLGVGGGSGSDDPRQMGYNEPPENTVITWNSTFRDYDPNRNVLRNRKEIVLFLGGAARPLDSRDVSDRSWRTTP